MATRTEPGPRRRAPLERAALWVAAVALGCGGHPHAPALHHGEAVYANPEQGLRFTPPPDWTEQARGQGYPDASAERLLVEYARLEPDEEAWLRLSMLDVSEAVPLADVLQGRAPGRAWRQTTAVEPLEVGGLPAARITYRGRWLREEFIREIVAVRRGPRVYFFTATYLPSNKDVPALVRQALASVVWETAGS